MNIDIVVGFNPCTGEEKKEEEILMCIFMGGIPKVKSFETQVVSATIMPGSSGSAVFNDRGELSGLVFAGSQGLSYGFIVPFEFLKEFLENQDKYSWRTPNKNTTPKKFMNVQDQFKVFCAAYPVTLCNEVTYVE